MVEHVAEHDMLPVLFKPSGWSGFILRSRGSVEVGSTFAKQHQSSLWEKGAGYSSPILPTGCRGSCISQHYHLLISNANSI